MLKINEEILYKLINENLEYFICDDVVQSYEKIKRFSTFYNLYLQLEYDNIQDYVLVDESSFLDYLGSYFTDAHLSKIGRVIMSLFVATDVGVGVAATGGITTGSAIAASSIAPGLLATVASVSISLAPIILLAFGFAFYKYFSNSELNNAKTMAKSLNSLSKALRFEISNQLNFNYTEIVKNKCFDINDKKLKMECALYEYLKSLTKFAVEPMVVSYVAFLKKSNENIQQIASFHQLMNFKLRTNSHIYNSTYNFYNSYVLLLNKIKTYPNFAPNTLTSLNKLTLKELAKS